MNRIAHLVQTLLTALVLVAGTLQMAYASGQAPAVDEMVICNGHSAVTIGIDADGNPTGEVFYCPDCAATALVAVEASAAPLPASRATISVVYVASEASLVVPLVNVPHPARGPPVSV